MTNGAKIRRSSNEELANLFMTCEFSFIVDVCSGNYSDDKEFLLEWLNQEADE